MSDAGRNTKSLGMSESSGPDGGNLLKPETKAMVNEGAVNNMQQAPPGAEFMKAYKAMLEAHKDMLAAAKPMQENEQVKAFMAKAEELLSKHEEEHKAVCVK